MNSVAFFWTRGRVATSMEFGSRRSAQVLGRPAIQAEPSIARLHYITNISGGLGGVVTGSLF